MSALADLPLELLKQRILTSQEAAAFKGRSDREWDRMRADGRTPPPVKRGKRALGYKLGDLIAMDQGDPLADAERSVKRLVEAINSGGVDRNVVIDLIDRLSAVARAGLQHNSVERHTE